MAEHEGHTRGCRPWLLGDVSHRRCEPYLLAADLAETIHDRNYWEQKHDELSLKVATVEAVITFLGPKNAKMIRAALGGDHEQSSQVTLHADQALPPDLAEALADLARATQESAGMPSYAVFVCAEGGIIGCRAVGPHREHDLAESPFIRAQDSSADSQTITLGGDQ